MNNNNWPNAVVAMTLILDGTHGSAVLHRPIKTPPLYPNMEIRLSDGTMVFIERIAILEKKQLVMLFCTRTIWAHDSDTGMPVSKQMAAAVLDREVQACLNNGWSYPII